MRNITKIDKCVTIDEMCTLFHDQKLYIRRDTKNGQQSCFGQSHTGLILQSQNETKSIAEFGVKVTLLFNE